MADNTPQQGTDTIASDDIGGIKYQRIKVTYGVDGAATDVNAATPLPVTLGANGTIPPALRTTDSIAAGLQTDAIMSGLTALTPKFAFSNVAASATDSSIVAAVASKRIRLLGVVLVTGGTATNLTFNSKPAGAGTAISPLLANASNSGVALAFCPVGWFQTNVGEGLTVTTGAGSTTGVMVVYVEA